MSSAASVAFNSATVRLSSTLTVIFAPDVALTWTVVGAILNAPDSCRSPRRSEAEF